MLKITLACILLSGCEQVSGTRSYALPDTRYSSRNVNAKIYYSMNLIHHCYLYIVLPNNERISLNLDYSICEELNLIKELEK